MKDGRISILIGTKNRPTELFGLLQSLRTQTYQDYDIYILDDASNIPLLNYYFITYIINRLKIEDHGVWIKRNTHSNGICRMRNQMVKWSIKNDDNEYMCRCDDDTLCDPDYLERLVNILKSKPECWFATGITPPLAQIGWKRDTKYVKPLMNNLEVKGDTIIKIGDDCGYDYITDEWIPTQHFRSSGVYRRSIHTDQDIWYATNFTTCGFREEEILSLQIISKGGEIWVDTGARNIHIMTPSGGDRISNYQELAIRNEEILREVYKKLYSKYGDFITKYNKKMEVK